MENSTEKQENSKSKPVSWGYKKQQEKVGNGDLLSFAWIYYDMAIDDIASRYVFEVRRYKIKSTKEEYLNVKVYEVERDKNGKVSNYDECAEIERVSIIDLEAKLLGLRIYGVMLERKHFPKIRQTIEKVYPELSRRYIDESTVVTDEVIHSIYEVFIRFIREVEIEADKGLYNIPVVDFKEHLSDSEYSKYKYSDIRAGLAQLKVEVNGKICNATKCSYGRTDNTVKVGNKLVKVISFIADAADNYQFTNLPKV